MPNTRSQAFLCTNNDTVPTGFSSTTGYFKTQGTTSLIRQQKFTSANNQVTYIGKSPTSVPVTAMIGGKSPQTNSDYFIVIGKNGTAIPLPEASIGSMLNGQEFQIVLESDVDLVTGNSLEIGIRNNFNINDVIVCDLQFRVSE